MLFDTRYYTGGLGRTYDVSPDGQRFLMIKSADVDLPQAPMMRVAQRRSLTAVSATLSA